MPGLCDCGPRRVPLPRTARCATAPAAPRCRRLRGPLLPGHHLRHRRGEPPACCARPCVRRRRRAAVLRFELPTLCQQGNLRAGRPLAAHLPPARPCAAPCADGADARGGGGWLQRPERLCPHLRRHCGWPPALAPAPARACLLGTAPLSSQPRPTPYSSRMRPCCMSLPLHPSFCWAAIPLARGRRASVLHSVFWEGGNKGAACGCPPHRRTVTKG